VLKKKFRLQTNSSFRATYFQNKVAADEFFVLYAGKTKENITDNTRAGFVVSKKVDKRSTVRNKIKRRLREAYFEYMKQNEIKYMSLIFIAKEKAKEASYFDTLKSVNKLIAKIANKFI